MTAKNLKTLVIINPISGSNPGRDFKALFEKHLASEKFDYRLEYTTHGGHATELAMAAVKAGTQVVIAVGGDGTINEVAKVLVHTSVYLGIVPSGSGNGLARHLKIPLSPEKSISFLNRATPVSIDTGQVNDHPFFCTSGVGFDAQIGQKFGSEGKRGLKTYIRTSVSEFFKYKAKHYVIKSEKYTIKKEAFIVTFANTNQYGNNALISPEASLHDGKIDICILKPFPKTALLGLSTRLFLGSIHKSSYMEILRSTNFVIERETEGVVHLDGEPLILGKTLQVNCLPDSLKVLSAATR